MGMPRPARNLLEGDPNSPAFSLEVCSSWGAQCWAGINRVWPWAWGPSRGWVLDACIPQNPVGIHSVACSTALCRDQGIPKGPPSPQDTQLWVSGEAGVLGSSLQGWCRAECGSFTLSGPCEEEVCRVDSSGQVNSGQMGPRYLPGDTRRAGFAQPGCLFALGRAFPSIGRQQRCRNVTPTALPGSSVTVLARCLHPGCGCCCGTAGLGRCAAPRATDLGTTASSPIARDQHDAQVSSAVAEGARGALGAQKC